MQWKVGEELPMHLALIGYRGAGKSTIGPLVASLCGALSVDADVEIERAQGQTIGEIFASRGQDFFRDLETQMLGKLVVGEHVAVLALGGGVILRPENRDLLRSCFTVWLTAPLEILLERLKHDAEKQAQRPSLTGLPQTEEVARLLREREPLYAMCADLTIDTSQTSAKAAAETILRQWRSRDAARGKE
jgi:shikimate kinase